MADPTMEDLLDQARQQTLSLVRKRRELGVAGSAELVLLGRLEAGPQQPAVCALAAALARPALPPPLLPSTTFAPTQAAAVAAAAVAAAAATEAAGTLRLLIALPPSRAGSQG